MAMSLGPGRRIKAEINLTPMIDVLLVLIIIFMMITPVPSQGLDALVPHPADASAPPQSPIVITVLTGGSVLLNQESLAIDALRNRLVRLFANGAKQVIFVRGEKDVEFAQVAQVIDIARGVGVDRVGLMTN